MIFVKYDYIIEVILFLYIVKILKFILKLRNFNDNVGDILSLVKALMSQKFDVPIR